MGLGPKFRRSLIEIQQPLRFESIRVEEVIVLLLCVLVSKGLTSVFLEILRGGLSNDKTLINLNKTFDYLWSEYPFIWYVFFIIFLQNYLFLNPWCFSLPEILKNFKTLIDQIIRNRVYSTTRNFLRVLNQRHTPVMYNKLSRH